MKLKCSLALSALPAHGLLKPTLLRTAVGPAPPWLAESHLARTTPDDLYIAFLHNEITRNAHWAVAILIGTYHSCVTARSQTALWQLPTPPPPLLEPAFLTAVDLGRRIRTCLHRPRPRAPYQGVRKHPGSAAQRRHRDGRRQG